MNLLCYILCSFVFCLTTFLAIFCYRRNGLGILFFHWWISSVCDTHELMNFWYMNFACYYNSRKLHTTIHINFACYMHFFTQVRNAHIWKRAFRGESMKVCIKKTHIQLYTHLTFCNPISWPSQKQILKAKINRALVQAQQSILCLRFLRSYVHSQTVLRMLLKNTTKREWGRKDRDRV